MLYAGLTADAVHAASVCADGAARIWVAATGKPAGAPLQLGRVREVLPLNPEAAATLLVVGEDGGVQALQRLSGLDPELVGEQVADPPVGGQRVGLLPAPVQRQDELAVQPFPQRMVGDQLFQFGGERVVPAKRQVSLDPALPGGEP